jgi:FKBP-type peptidyl-prolyl cis-trans isomerase SlpA
MLPATQTINPGCRVVLTYSLSLEDGRVINKTDSHDPLDFLIGDGTFPNDVEAMFYGMKAGESDKRTFTPEQGWGYPDPKNVQRLSSNSFPDKKMLKLGKVIEFELPNKETLPGTVLEINGEQIKVDFNPPLAGHHVTLEVRILSVHPQPNSH